MYFWRDVLQSECRYHQVEFELDLLILVSVLITIMPPKLSKLM